MITLRSYFLLLCLALLPSLVKAQQQDMGNFKINGFSDQQIVLLWQQSLASGMSESDAMKLLVKRGLPASEVNAFKRRLIALQAAKKSQFTQNNLIKDTSSFMRDSTWVLEVPEIRKPTNKYGYEFFSNPNISFEPNLRLATPKSYVLGPDDQLGITLTGLNETDQL
ncbi:MAG: hypothetical protein ACKO8Q_07180, partial [Bacteroidota bacterium]